MSYKNSNKLYQKGLKHLVGAVNSPVRAFKSVGGNPIFINKAKGSSIIDVDGNRYVDYVQSYGPMILGHRHKKVQKSIHKALKHGYSFGASTKSEIKLAQIICDVFPRMDKIRAVAKKLNIIEKRMQMGDYPDTASEFIIPQSDIVVITGSSFVNKSYKRLLELSQNSYTILIGPSVIMSDVLFDYGADVLAGSRIVNCKGVLEAVSQGGHLKDFSKYIEYVMKFKER